MSNTNISTPLVSPSQNDINGGVTNDGKFLLEKYIREWHKSLCAINYVISGGALPSSDADLVVPIPAGVAYIDGYYVTWAQTNITLPNNQTSHIFVKLNFSGGIVASGATAVQIEDNTTGTHPASSVKLGTMTTSGGVTVSSVDQRLLDGNQRIRRAVISALGSTSWIVPANITKIRIRQWGAGGGGGGGGGGSLLQGTSGGYGSAGCPGGYFEAVVSVTPGATITIVNGTGGSPGSGGATEGGNGTAGTAGGTSSAAGSGFSFSNPGGDAGGAGAAGGSSSGANYYFRPAGSSPSASSGSLDCSIDGGGNAGGRGGDGGNPSPTAGQAGTSGRSAVTIIDY